MSCELLTEAAEVPTSTFPLAVYPFPMFNPIQSAVLPKRGDDANWVVAAATAAGKTCCAEILFAQELIHRGGSCLYLGPMRALAQEKYDAWTSPDHHFGEMRTAICTGDYKLTPEKRQALSEAHIILMTPEMLGVRCRHAESENSEFLGQVGTLVVDESHLLASEGRGSHLEVALMTFTKYNPNARVVFLSATMPNVQQLAEWLASLNGKHTYLLKSDWRPCPLTVHYESHPASQRYDQNEQAKIDATLKIVNEHSTDKFLLFVHTKATGELLMAALKRGGITAEYHNADVDKETRTRVENDFRAGKGARCVVATSSLAWGCNFPARRVVVLGTTRGLQQVEVFDVLQMIGRAGRPGYDPAGDAYILLPDRQFAQLKTKYSKPTPITSQMLSSSEAMGGGHRVLEFHLVGEIHRERVKTPDDVVTWYSRTLASFQETLLETQTIDAAVAELTENELITFDDGQFAVTPLGAAASLFYMSPLDVGDLYANMSALFKLKLASNDNCLVLALANLRSVAEAGYVSKAEANVLVDFKGAVRSDPCIARLAGELFDVGGFPDPVIKNAYAYLMLMNGNKVGILTGLMNGLSHDFARVAEVLRMIDSMAGHWSADQFFDDLSIRITCRVPKEFVPLCRIEGVGGQYAAALYGEGLRTPQDVVRNPSIVRKFVRGEYRAATILVNAAKLCASQTSAA